MSRTCQACIIKRHSKTLTSIAARNKAAVSDVGLDEEDDEYVGAGDLDHGDADFDNHDDNDVAGDDGGDHDGDVEDDADDDDDDNYDAVRAPANALSVDQLGNSA